MVERMETRPPALMTRLVRALIPPASREHVLGDLNERYVSPRQYVFEALRALPRTRRYACRRLSRARCSRRPRAT